MLSIYLGEKMATNVTQKYDDLSALIQTVENKGVVESSGRVTSEYPVLIMSPVMKHILFVPSPKRQKVFG